MKILSHQVQADGVVLITSTGRITVQQMGPSAMRVRVTGPDEVADPPSLMLIDGLMRTAPQVEASSDATLVLSTSRLRVEIDRRWGTFTWTDEHGNLLVREPRDRQETKVLAPVDVLRSVVDDQAEISTVRGADGERAVVAQTRTVVDRKAFSTMLRLELADGEAIYGLGQHEEGIGSYRGHHQYLYQQNMKIVAPVIVSTKGYAILWDSQSAATFHDDQYGTYFWTDVDDAMDFLVVAGPEVDDIVREIRRLTGEAPMLPRWAFGYIQSKDRYVDAGELVDVVREFRRRNLPLDCIVQDWQHWPDGQWGQKSFDLERFADPASFIDQIHRLDAHLMVSIWPNMHGDGANRTEFSEHGQLLGDGSTYDAFDPAARDRYWAQVREGYARHGVDAFWADCTEPFEADWKGAVEPQPEERWAINTGAAKRFIDPERLNAYSLMHSEGLYRGHRADVPDKRVFALTRSGFTGQQRYSAVTWSGDHSATWQTLRRQIADGLNLMITGTPYWSFDIGAYFVTPDPDGMWFWRGDFADGVADLGYRELYVRWLQMGTFLPIMRSHGRCTPREPWQFGDVGDVHYDAIAAFLRLRYRLLPYLYSLAGATTQHAYTPMRSLVFDFRHDPAVFDVTDQFMLGPALLVCPVTHPIHHGPDSEPLTGVPLTRRVYLPAGCDWYDFWTGRRHLGGQTIDADASLDRIPLFVRAGSVLPLGPVVEHTGQDPHGPVELRVFPGADGTFELYDDAGDGYGYEGGELTTTLLDWSDATRTLTIGDRTGSYPAMPDRRRFAVVVVGEGAGVGAGEPGSYPIDHDGAAQRMTLT
ncbi:MAG: TIM-barrel domain-containing protein [Cellulomonas sp.]